MDQGVTMTSNESVPGTRLIWWFPDGDLPDPVVTGALVGHEALIILNPTKAPARIDLTFYWTDRAPTHFDPGITVEPERVRCLRLDQLSELGIDFRIPTRTQYSIRVASTVPVFCQYGRLESARPPVALLTSNGFG
jgi:hypothetical protein